jgi:hypothetical protein
MTNKITWYLLYRHKMKFTCSDFENWLMIILIDCHYIKVFPHFPWYYNLHTHTYLISELQYPFIGVLECKFNLDGLLQVNYELKYENKTWFSPTTRESWSGGHRYPCIPNFHPETFKVLIF